eukprot:1197138-Rhodomonas_salina.1
MQCCPLAMQCAAPTSRMVLQPFTVTDRSYAPTRRLYWSSRQCRYQEAMLLRDVVYSEIVCAYASV